MGYSPNDPPRSVRFSVKADIDHPVNVIEAKDTIVLQVRSFFFSVSLSCLPSPTRLTARPDSLVAPSFQLTSDGKLKNGNRINTDLLYILRFTEDGEKIRSIDIWSVSPSLVAFPLIRWSRLR